jgi:predicted PurR-regulated permease PerM
VLNVSTLEKEGIAAPTSGEAIGLTSLVSTAALIALFGTGLAATAGRHLSPGYLITAGIAVALVALVAATALTVGAHPGIAERAVRRMAGWAFSSGLVTLVVFLAYTQIENHILNPLVMSRTTKVNPLLVLMSILVGTSVGDWGGGTFGAFTAALVSIPLAGALQVTVRELWQVTAWTAGEAATEAAGRED